MPPNRTPSRVWECTRPTPYAEGVHKWRLPEGFLANRRAAVTLEGGGLALPGWTDGDARPAIAVLGGREPQMLHPAELPSDPFAEHEAVVIAQDGGGFGVIVDPETLVVHRDGGTRGERVPIVNPEAIESLEPAYTLSALAPKSRGAAPLVILRHGVLVRETHLAIPLHLEAGGARWGEPFRLDAAAFPVDRLGAHVDPEDAGDDAPVIGATLAADGRRYVFVEGSDRGSVNRSGMDYAACVEVDADGRVLRTRYTASGWKRQPGKHGLTGAFTGDGRFAVLTPVFGTGPWKGRQRVLDLETGAVGRPIPRRVPSGAALLEHDEGGWWLLTGDGTVLHVELQLRDDDVPA